jgi:pimeloyl-ACP methyl ester carboxylesterase
VERELRSPYANYACVDTGLTDFRDDLPKLDVPTLVLHGTADRPNHDGVVQHYGVVQRSTS